MHLFTRARIVIGALCGVTWAFPATVGAVPFIADQANDGFTQGLIQSIQIFSPIGQEFTPSLPALDVVELLTHDFGGSSGADLVVHIRLGTITGTLLGRSLPVSLPDAFAGVTHFDFPATVALVPGQLYVIEVLVASGDNWGIESSGGPHSTSSLGNQIIRGRPEPDNDLWFREGPAAIPEPGTLLLLGAGLLGFGGYRRFRAL